VKDEGLNSTGSFKARGLSCWPFDVPRTGREEDRDRVGRQRGKRGGGLCGPAAAIEAHIFMPKDVPQANYIECKSYGAQVTLVERADLRLRANRRRAQGGRRLV